MRLQYQPGGIAGGLGYFIKGFKWGFDRATQPNAEERLQCEVGEQMKDSFSKIGIVRIIVLLVLCILSYFNWEWIAESNTNILISLVLFFILEFVIGFLWDSLKIQKDKE